MSAVRKFGPSAEIIAIRATAKMYITVWDLPELTWARSGVGIDVRPGAISQGDYSDIVRGMKDIGLIGKLVPDHAIQVVRNTADTELFDILVHGVGSYRVAPSGSGFARVPH